MDKQEETEETFYKVRRVKTCVTDGLMLPVRNFLPLMRMLWIPMLLSALCMAALTRAVAPLAAFLADMPVLSECTYAGCWLLSKIMIQLLVILIFGSMTFGQLGAAVSIYARMGYIPKLKIKVAYKYMLSNYMRALLWNGGWIVAGGVLVTLFSWLLGVKWTLGVVIPLAFLFLFVPYCLVGIKYLIDENGKLTWGDTFKFGYKYWGSLFAVIGVCGLLSLVYVVVGFLPAGILSYAEMSYQISLHEGDLVTNPSLFLYGRMFFSFVSFLFCSMALWTVYFPLSFLFASLCEKSEMQRKYEDLE